MPQPGQPKTAKINLSSIFVTLISNFGITTVLPNPVNSFLRTASLKLWNYRAQKAHVTTVFFEPISTQSSSRWRIYNNAFQIPSFIFLCHRILFVLCWKIEDVVWHILWTNTTFCTSQEYCETTSPSKTCTAIGKCADFPNFTLGSCSEKQLPKVLFTGTFFPFPFNPLQCPEEPF